MTKLTAEVQLSQRRKRKCLGSPRPLVALAAWGAGLASQGLSPAGRLPLEALRPSSSPVPTPRSCTREAAASPGGRAEARTERGWPAAVTGGRGASSRSPGVRRQKAGGVGLWALVALGRVREPCDSSVQATGEGRRPRSPELCLL